MFTNFVEIVFLTAPPMAARGRRIDTNFVRFWAENGRSAGSVPLNNVNNSKGCEHQTTLGLVLNSKSTLGLRLHVWVLYKMHLMACPYVRTCWTPPLRASQRARLRRAICKIENRSKLSMPEGFSTFQFFRERSTRERRVLSVYSTFRSDKTAGW